MVSSQAIPWYNRPPREFPAQRWAQARYAFRLPPLRFRPRDQPRWREFPAKRWREERLRQAGVC